jgi:phenylpyruvate tautomerase PptA (4-oxalocrotonate tautomerase family)
MPMIELTLEEGALTDDARADLVEGLTAALLRAEGAPDNEMSRSIAWAYVDERPAGSINVGGRPADAPRYRVKLTVPEGALDDDSKAQIVEDATKLVLQAEGAADDPAAAFRVWVIVREVKDGNWGGAGRIFRLRDIAKAINGGGMPGAEAEKVAG